MRVLWTILLISGMSFGQEAAQSTSVPGDSSALMPGADNKSVKDSEGTIQQDKDTGKKIEEGAKGGVYGASGGALAGGLSGGLNGARVGAAAGAAVGIGWAPLKRGNDVKLDVGTSIESEIQRPITVDASRIAVAKATP